MDEVLNFMNDISLANWDDQIEINLMRQIAWGVSKVWDPNIYYLNSLPSEP